MKYPDKVDIIEVGPRDGFQNIRDFIPTDIKLREIDLLMEAGVREIEVTSFVHPKAIPQMADATDVARSVRERWPQAQLIALVPNARGVENALRCGIDRLSYVISVSEAHNKANINRTVAESLEALRTIREDYPNARIRVDLATAFGCPFEGHIPLERVLSLAKTATELGAEEIVLCDTIGISNPKLTTETVCAVMGDNTIKDAGVTVSLHMHDTRGQGLANALAAMLAGVTRFETSVGGLGGCPFAPGAAGNTATEDLLNMLLGMGINTGVQMPAYMKAVQYVKENIQASLLGHLSNIDARYIGC